MAKRKSDPLGSKPRRVSVLFRLPPDTRSELEDIRQRLGFRTLTQALIYAAAFARAEMWVKDSRVAARVATDRTMYPKNRRPPLLPLRRDNVAAPPDGVLDLVKVARENKRGR